MTDVPADFIIADNVKVRAAEAADVEGVFAKAGVAAE